jgi:hypothetical protein
MIPMICTKAVDNARRHYGSATSADAGEDQIRGDGASRRGGKVTEDGY